MIELKTALSGSHARGLHSRPPMHIDRRGRRYPIPPAKPLDGVVLGTKPAPIDNDTHADCCILLAVLAKTKPEKVAEFFALTGDAHQKIAFLLRHAHFEPWQSDQKARIAQ